MSLQVVPRDAVAPEHYTMSASGLVHVTPRLAPDQPPASEFIALSSWLREMSVFNLMRQMRVFQLYLHRKMFHIWRNKAHAAIYRRARLAVCERLFFAKPTFATLLMDARRLIHDACSSPLLPFEGPQQVCGPRRAAGVLGRRLGNWCEFVCLRGFVLQV
jgi:hypothetical protein